MRRPKLTAKAREGLKKYALGVRSRQVAGKESVGSNDYMGPLRRHSTVRRSPCKAAAHSCVRGDDVAVGRTPLTHIKTHPLRLL